MQTVHNPSNQRADGDLLTESEARAQELPMSLAWYRRKRLCGGEGPPFVRIGNRVFYRRSELRAWISRQPNGGGDSEAR